MRADPRAPASWRMRAAGARILRLHADPAPVDARAAEAAGRRATALPARALLDAGRMNADVPGQELLQALPSAPWTTPVKVYASKTLVSVRPETPLTEVQKLLLEHDISAVPVVDGRGELQGILSTTDLLREARIDITMPGGSARITPPPRAARDLMRREVITVDEGAPLSRAAQDMTTNRIHRVVVTRRGAPVGVFTTRDAMRAVHFHRVELPLERVMTTPVETIDESETIRSAVERLTDTNVRGLVVVDGTWPIGVFTHTEALLARALPALLLETPVERAMSYETICLDIRTPLYRVAGHAIQMRVKRILAVHARELRGIVSGLDLVRVMTLP